MSRLISAKVQNGVIVVHDLARLPEGLTADVVVPDDEPIVLATADEDEMIDRVAEADRGDTFVPAEEVLRDLHTRRPRGS